MGWNIFYKECKYIAAHQILKSLNKKKNAYAISTFGTPATDMTDIQPTPQWTTLKDVKEVLRIFPMYMIKDAAFMMHDVSNNTFKKEVDLMNSGRISEIKVKILWDGETALKDRKYWRLFFGSAKIIIPLIIAIITGLYAAIKYLI